MLFCGDCFGLLVKWGGDCGGHDFIEYQVEIFFWLDNACTDIQIFYWYIFVLNEPASLLQRYKYVKLTLIHFMKLNIKCVFLKCTGNIMYRTPGDIAMDERTSNSKFNHCFKFFTQHPIFSVPCRSPPCSVSSYLRHCLLGQNSEFS